MMHKRFKLFVIIFMIVVMQGTFSMEMEEGDAKSDMWDTFAGCLWKGNNGYSELYSLDENVSPELCGPCDLLKVKLESNKPYYVLYLSPKLEKNDTICRTLIECIKNYPLLQYSIAKLEIFNSKGYNKGFPSIKITCKNKIEAQTVLNCLWEKFKESDSFSPPKALKDFIALYNAGEELSFTDVSNKVTIYNERFGFCAFSKTEKLKDYTLQMPIFNTQQLVNANNNNFSRIDDFIKDANFKAARYRITSTFHLFLNCAESLISLQDKSKKRETILHEVKKRNYGWWMLASFATGVTGVAGSYFLFKSDYKFKNLFSIVTGVSSCLSMALCARVAKKDYETIPYKELIEEHLNEWYKKWIPGTDGKNHYEEID
jgi:hypothetical protein